jgi:hypothetical protein
MSVQELAGVYTCRISEHGGRLDVDGAVALKLHSDGTFEYDYESCGGYDDGPCVNKESKRSGSWAVVTGEVVLTRTKGSYCMSAMNVHQNTDVPGPVKISASNVAKGSFTDPFDQSVLLTKDGLKAPN